MGLNAPSATHCTPKEIQWGDHFSPDNDFFLSPLKHYLHRHRPSRGSYGALPGTSVRDILLRRKHWCNPHTFISFFLFFRPVNCMWILKHRSSFTLSPRWGYRKSSNDWARSRATIAKQCNVASNHKRGRHYLFYSQHLSNCMFRWKVPYKIHHKECLARGAEAVWGEICSVDQWKERAGQITCSNMQQHLRAETQINTGSKAAGFL